MLTAIVSPYIARKNIMSNNIESASEAAISALNAFLPAAIITAMIQLATNGII